MPIDPAPHSRSSVVEAGHHGDLSVLVPALGAADPSVRSAALGGLARCGDLTAANLAAAVSDASPAVRRRAAGLLGTPAARALDPDGLGVRTLLADPESAVAEWACWAAGERPEVADALLGRLAALAVDHADDLVREAAVAALGSLGDERGRDAVLAACDDVATVRRRAVLALVAFDGADVEAALARLATDRDWQVRQAAEELAAIGGADDPTT